MFIRAPGTERGLRLDGRLGAAAHVARTNDECWAVHITRNARGPAGSITDDELRNCAYHVHSSHESDARFAHVAHDERSEKSAVPRAQIAIGTVVRTSDGTAIES